MSVEIEWSGGKVVAETWQEAWKAIFLSLAEYDENGNVIRELTDDEKWDVVRGVRDMLLSKTDWIVAKCIEVGKPVPEEWKSYRQKLRDIPETYDAPENVEFPVKPSSYP